ncbi:MAG: GtrA family protein [Pikeienuella sp.]
MSDTARQFVRFVGVGAIATAAHYALLIGLVTAGVLSPVPASAAGAVLGALVSYGLNRRYTFRSSRAHAAALPRFLTVAALAFLANLCLMVLLHSLAGLPYLLAQMLTTGLVLGLTFTLNRAWSFRQP